MNFVRIGFFQSLRFKIILTMLLLSTLPMFLLTYLAINASTQTLLDSVTKDLEEKAFLVGKGIDRFIYQREVDIKILSQADVLESQNEKAIMQYLKEIDQESGYLDGISIIEREGVISYSSRKQDKKGASLKELYPELITLFDQVVKSKQGDVYVSEAMLFDKGFGLAFLTPITDDSNTKVLRVLLSQVNLNSIQTIVSEFDKSVVGDKYVYLVDDHGYIISSDDPRLKKNDIFPDLSNSPEFKDLFLGRQVRMGNIVYKDSDGDKVVAGIADIAQFGVNKALNWNIIAIAPVNRILQPAYVLRSLLLMLMTAIVLLIALLAIYIGTRFSRVLRESAEIAEKVSQGDLNVNLYSERKDELGQLQNAIHQIIQNYRLIHSQAEAIALGDFSNYIKRRSEDDNLSKALIDMNSYLNHLAKQADEIAKGNLDIKIIPKSHKDQLGSSLAVMTNKLIDDIHRRETAEKTLLLQKDILDYQAHHDPLTELPNRALFKESLSKAIEKAKRHGNELALFFIDIDRFKQINDSLGHGIGDKVLQEVSERIKDVLRKEDTLARLGGDEFTVLVEDMKQELDASYIAQKILDSLSVPVEVDFHNLYITASIGISIYPKDDTDMDRLLMFADAAMYKAKDEGKNNFQFYSAEMTVLAFEHVHMVADLREALVNDEFFVYYQPQINAKSGKLIGVEALVRWQQPDRGLVPPNKFITLAEETGLIVQLDRWVMKTAIRQIVQWYRSGDEPGVLSLNLAMQQLHQKDFIKILQEMLIDEECKPEWLELEVTESQIMKEPEKAIAILKKISEMGIRLAIDDFGTGYSSLSYLKRLPIDKLKIDQSFVKDLPYDEEDVAISKAVIALAKSLNLNVIAEGVETEEQKDFLMNNGCENIQGYYYARPMPPDEVKAMFLLE